MATKTVATAEGRLRSSGGSLALDLEACGRVLYRYIEPPGLSALQPGARLVVLAQHGEQRRQAVGLEHEVAVGGGVPGDVPQRPDLLGASELTAKAARTWTSIPLLGDAFWRRRYYCE